MSTNTGAVVSSEPPSNGDVAVNNEVQPDSKTETLTTEPSAGGIVVQDLVDDARVSSAASECVQIGADLVESKSGTLVEAVMDISDHDGGGDIAVQDTIDEATVSRDELGLVVENSELGQDLVDVARVSSVVMDNDEKRLDESGADAAASSVPPAANDGGEIGVVTQNTEKVLDKPISDALVSSVPLSNKDIDAVNRVKIGADSLGSKPETLTVKPSADQNRDEEGTVVENIEVNYEEKEGEYKVADIVWAKVKNYPWWPGQIFDPASSTDKAKKHSNKKGFLVGYFGDQTFAWNKASNIKPFRKNFRKMEKQSNSKAFFHAVDCALDEVTRRVDFGLACSCLSKEVYDTIKTQVFVNSGVREEDSKIDGGDRFSTVSTFKPVTVVQSVQELARDQVDGFSRLEVLSVRTQLLAFFRWKGYYQLQAQDILDGPENKSEDESGLPLTEENKVVKDGKPASVGKKVSSKKMEPDVSDSDDSVPLKKERSLTNVTPKGNSSVEKSKKNISKKTAAEDSVDKKVSSKKRKPDVSDSDDSVPRKKERSLSNMTSKGVKGSKKSISKKETVEDIVDSEENGDEKPDSVVKKVSSKKSKPDVSDGDDFVPRKKERSLSNMSSKGEKRSKKSISKKATVEDNVDSEENGDKKLDSVGKKVPSKKRKLDVSDSDDSVPHKKERSLTNITSKGMKRSKKSSNKKTTVEDDVVSDENGIEKPDSVGKKVSSKKRKPDVSDSDDSVPHKKERSLTKITSKGMKRSKKSSNKKTTVEDDAVSEENGNEKPDSVGKKVSSKKRKPDVGDSDDSVPHKKERSLTNITSKGMKRRKKSSSKKATVEDDVVSEENGNEIPDSVGKKASSKKRKPDVGDSDDSVPHKKERSLTNITSKGNSSVKRTKQRISKKATVEDNEENGNGTDSKKSSISTPKNLFRVGDTICKIAKQISESPVPTPVLGKTAKKDGKSVEATQTEE